MDIVITACKNGAADLIAIYSTQPKELALAFDVASLEGVEISLKAAVIDCCVKSLSLNEDYLTAAANRCLISLDSATRVHKPCLQYMLQCGNIQLRSLAFIAMAAGKKKTDKELVKQSLLNCNTDKFAFIHVIAVAYEDNYSSLIIDDIKKRKDPLSTQEFRCIIKMANKTENVQVFLNCCKYYLHRLVAEQFVPNDDIEHKTERDYIIRIHDDNCISNLR